MSEKDKADEAASVNPPPFPFAVGDTFRNGVWVDKDGRKIEVDERNRKVKK